MAATLRMVFGMNGGKKVTLAYPHAKQTATSAQVRTAMEAIVTNKDIFPKEPQTIIGAEIVERIVTTLDVE